MPRRTDLKSILLLGSGPSSSAGVRIRLLGRSGAQALREEGYRTILLNSNPATIMTDAEWADRTYIEPITVEAAERIIAGRAPGRPAPDHGRADGAQARGCSLQSRGILAKYGCQLIGAQLDAIEKAEDASASRTA